MLPLSDLTIVFKKSNDFLRCSLLIHALALFVLYYSGLPVYWFIGALVFFYWPLKAIMINRRPHPQIHGLSYHRQHWLLHTTSGETLNYQSMQIKLDTGFFLLISLCGLKRTKSMIIFHDQLTRDECRMLHVIERVTSETISY